MKAILPNPAYALDFRLKSPESLLRKIETDSMVKGISVSEAAADIGDALRYTMILPEESFSQSVMSTLNHLDASGAQILKLKNTFVEGASYKGINSNFLTAEGQVVELQFHTEPSFAVKQANHVEYEEARLASTSAERRLALEAQMQASAHGVTLPPGVDAVRLDRVGVPNTGAVRFTGAGTTTTDALAESTYDQIRALKMSDIGTISESTGLSISEATTLKKHLFFGKHSLPVGSPDGVTFQLSRFTADDELAFAWQRAQKG
ncbi:hypothetical protein, partial [Chitinimonas sp.]|uniref:hypothetical protein n=1 Tax=Chitinimonas sp. TaxID=1934313 RepID=UPI0035B2D56B